MESLEAERERALNLDVSELTDAIESIGFECTRCGECCTREDRSECERSDREDESEREQRDSEDDEHTATVFPDEIRDLQKTEGDAVKREWRDVARPMPFGLDEEGSGETFEWALQTDSCGDCAFYTETDGIGACTVHGSRPLICRTYPFSIALGGTAQPLGEPVDTRGLVRAHECDGLGRDIERGDAMELAKALKARAVRELEEAIDLRDNYEPANPATDETVVHDSEGQKRLDGTPL